MRFTTSMLYCTRENLFLQDWFQLTLPGVCYTWVAPSRLKRGMLEACLVCPGATSLHPRTIVSSGLRRRSITAASLLYLFIEGVSCWHVLQTHEESAPAQGKHNRLPSPLLQEDSRWLISCSRYPHGCCVRMRGLVFLFGDANSQLVMVAKHIQQGVKKVHQGLEIVGLMEALAHFEQSCTC
jgi:hypothetical protein